MTRSDQTTIEAAAAYPAYGWAAVAADDTIIVDSVASDRDHSSYSVEHLGIAARIVRVRIEPVGPAPVGPAPSPIVRQGCATGAVIVSNGAQGAV